MGQQNDIGWQTFIEGWTAMEWESAQQDYYNFIMSRRTGKHWMTALSRKLWLVAWDLWEHRNGILHAQTNTISDKKLQAVNRKVTVLFSKYQQILTATIEKYLFSVPLQQLLMKDFHYKEEWINILESVLQSKEVQISEGAMNRMRGVMRRWLRPRRH